MVSFSPNPIAPRVIFCFDFDRSLNTQAPENLQFWVNGTVSRPPGVWEMTVPSNSSLSVDLSQLGQFDPDDYFEKLQRSQEQDEDKVKDHSTKSMFGYFGSLTKKQRKERMIKLTSPRPVATSGPLYEFVSGGFTDGKSDPSVLIGINAKTLYQRRGGDSSTPLTASPLPVVFADPTVFPVKDGIPQTGPISHEKTVSVAVDPADSKTIAVTGWPEDMVDGEESIFLTYDAGESWVEIIGNLVAVTKTVYKARPAGLLIVPFPAQVFLRGSLIRIGP